MVAKLRPIVQHKILDCNGQIEKKPELIVIVISRFDKKNQNCLQTNQNMDHT